jgi:hypothetical protein
MAGIKVARVQTNAHKNVVVRVEYEDGVLRVLFAGHYRAVAVVAPGRCRLQGGSRVSPLAIAASVSDVV